MANDIFSIDKQIAELEARKKRLLTASRGKALKEVKEAIAKYGFTASQLGLKARGGRAGAGKKARAKAKAKYANPANPKETWSGRGASPRWLRELVTQGRKKDDFLISNG